MRADSSAPHNLQGNTALLIGLVWLVGLVVFAPMMWQWRTLSDYEVHNALVVRVVEQPYEFFRNTPHFLYHVASALPYRWLPAMDHTQAGAIIMTLTYLATMTVILWYLLGAARSRLTNSLLAALGALTIGLMLVAPINLFTPDNLYFGYFAPHVYHNPTVNMMKPFAVLLFIAVVPLFRAKQPLSWRWLPAYGALTAACLLAKPSFVLALLPALALLALYRMVRRQAVHWPLLIGGVVIPAGALLAYQTVTWTSGGGIGVDFLYVFREWTLHYDAQAASGLLPKLLLSIAFPLAVYGLHLRSAGRDLAFNLAWLIAAVAIVYAYFMVDYTVVAAGDFNWSSQIAMLILFVAAAGFGVRHYTQLWQAQGRYTVAQMARLAACGLLFALHGVAGLHWYHLHRLYDPIALLYGVW